MIREKLNIDETRLLALGCVHYDLELITHGGYIPEGISMPTPVWVDRALHDIEVWKHLVSRGLATHLRSIAGGCDTYRAKEQNENSTNDDGAGDAGDGRSGRLRG